MIWFIIGIFFIVVGIFCALSEDRLVEEASGVCLTLGISINILSYLFINTLGMGISSLMFLESERVRIETLKDGIEIMRNSYYKEGLNEGAILSGSLDNLGQSKALSSYVGEYLNDKSRYNRDLKRKQEVKKTGGIYWWFSDAAFIPKEVLEMELL